MTHSTNRTGKTVRTLVGSGLLLWGAVAAATVTFDESGIVSVVDDAFAFTTDPVIDGYSFTAGDPANFTDTYVDEFLNPGNHYLSSGWDDLHNHTGLGDNATVIHIDAPGASVGGVGFDTTIDLMAAFDVDNPSGHTLVMQALLGGVVQGSDTLFQDFSTSFEAMSISLVDVAFDSVLIFHDATVGDPFRIDDFTVTSSDNTGGPGPVPGPGVPVPGVLFLMGAGLLGMGWKRKR